MASRDDIRARAVDLHDQVAVLAERVAGRLKRCARAAELGDSYEAALEAHRASLAAQEARLLSLGVAKYLPGDDLAVSAAALAAKAHNDFQRAVAQAGAAEWENDPPAPRVALG